MVYCGKPSKDCAPCRKRRTKCDLGKPSCSQCVRTGRVCSGYRDPLALTFRDQTKDFVTPRPHAASRIRTSMPEDIASSSFGISNVDGPTSPSEAPSRQLVSKVMAVTITPPLKVPLQQQATCYFFHNYVYDEASDGSAGYMGYLPHVYDNQTVDTTLNDSIVALGLVGIGNTRKSSSALTAAHSSYVKALSGINAKLRNAKDSRSDQALVIVMLLGMYEQNTCKSSQSMEAWTKHIDGAVTLLRLRGLGQLKSKVGSRVFLQLRIQVISNGMQRQVAIPDYILQWNKILREYQNPRERLNSQFSEIVMRFCNLRASIRDKSHWKRYSKEIICWALSIDQECTNWAAVCPSYGMNRTARQAEPNESVYSNYYYVYPNVWTAAIWNHYSCIRILINEIIYEQHLAMARDESYFDHLATYSLDEQGRILASEANLFDLAFDVCASVPYIFHYHRFEDRDASDESDWPPKAFNGTLLLWPLYAAAVVDIVPDDMRRWVIDRLHRIVEVMGVRQAAALADALDLPDRDISEWKGSEDDNMCEIGES